MRLILIPLLCFSAILALSAPVSVFAQPLRPDVPGESTYGPGPLQSYVPCGTLDVQKNVPIVDPITKKITGTNLEGSVGDGIVDNPCGFNHVIEFASRAITAWIMAGATVAALGFAYAGFLYITAMGSQEKISHAHMIFVKTFWGFVFMLSAWLIAKTMEQVFLTDEMKAKSFLYTTPP